MSNLARRLLIAAVGIPAVVFISMAGGILFLLLVCLLSTLALREFYRLVESKGVMPLKAAGAVAGLLLVIAFYHRGIEMALADWCVSHGGGLLFPSLHQLLMIIALLTVVGVTVIELFRNRPSPIMNIATTLFGVVYVSFFFGTLVGLRELFNPFDIPVPRYFPEAASFADPSVAVALDRWGGLTIVCLFASIWLCDSAAYAVGIPLGKHKLFPRVSPKKSWEGAIAGLLAGVAGMLAARSWFLPYLTLTDAIVLGFIVGGLGQIGDLVESLLKRDASVKDSSNLIPGHGGVLDRFDSLLFVSPLVYLYIDFVVFS